MSRKKKEEDEDIKTSNHIFQFYMHIQIKITNILLFLDPNKRILINKNKNSKIPPKNKIKILYIQTSCNVQHFDKHQNRKPIFK